MATLWSSNKPVNQKDLAELTLSDKHTISRMIKRLESNGWINKEPDPSDARITRIVPTKKGSELKNEIPEKLSKHIKEKFKVLSKDEKNSLLYIMKKLRISLE